MKSLTISNLHCNNQGKNKNIHYQVIKIYTELMNYTSRPAAG